MDGAIAASGAPTVWGGSPRSGSCAALRCSLGPRCSPARPTTQHPCGRARGELPVAPCSMPHPRPPTLALLASAAPIWTYQGEEPPIDAGSFARIVTQARPASQPGVCVPCGWGRVGSSARGLAQRACALLCCAHGDPCAARDRRRMHRLRAAAPRRAPPMCARRGGRCRSWAAQARGRAAAAPCLPAVGSSTLQLTAAPLPLHGEAGGSSASLLVDPCVFPSPLLQRRGGAQSARPWGCAATRRWRAAPMWWRCATGPPLPGTTWRCAWLGLLAALLAIAANGGSGGSSSSRAGVAWLGGNAHWWCPGM